MSKPSTATYHYVIPLADVAAHHPKGRGDLFDRLAAMWAMAVYGLYAGYVAGVVPGWLFVPLGVCAFVRNFNALHEGFHAPRATGRWRRWRHLFVVTSPFMLGYHPLKRNHSEHHTWAQQPDRDPDAYLAYGPWWRALFNAITQPEQGFFRYLCRHDFSRELWARLLIHSAVFASLAVASLVGLGHLGGLLAWVLMTRIGNTASWFIFDWVLHHPAVWGRWSPPGLPRPLRAVWALLFGEDNLLGVEYHFVHHHYHFVPGQGLPGLAQEVRARA